MYQLGHRQNQSGTLTEIQTGAKESASLLFPSHHLAKHLILYVSAVKSRMLGNTQEHVYPRRKQQRHLPLLMKKNQPQQVAQLQLFGIIQTQVTACVQLWMLALHHG
jgi:hypothetical protein